MDNTSTESDEDDGKMSKDSTDSDDDGKQEIEEDADDFVAAPAHFQTFEVCNYFVNTSCLFFCLSQGTSTGKACRVAYCSD